MSYGTPTPEMRGSDISRRIYAAVRILEITGESNWDACVTVAERLKGRLGRSRRGRGPRSDGSIEFAHLVETVRSLYNRYKTRGHRWKQFLPGHDHELEYWWGAFLAFRGRATAAEKPRGVNLLHGRQPLWYVHEVTLQPRQLLRDRFSPDSGGFIAAITASAQVPNRGGTGNAPSTKGFRVELSHGTKKWRLAKLGGSNPHPLYLTRPCAISPTSVLLVRYANLDPINVATVQLILLIYQ